jgi:DNA-binding NarL/FixJ family response regulator
MAPLKRRQPEPSEQRQITLVIADRHPIALEGLQRILTSAQYTVSASCTDGVQAMQAVQKHRPDIFLFGLHLARRDGLKVLRDLRRDNASPHAIFLADGREEANIVDALRLGVRGVFLKEMAPHLLLECVRTVANGQRWLEKVSVARLLDKLLQREAASPQPARELTNREVEIIRLIAKGFRNRAIAAQLFVTEGTVKIHLHHIYRKLKVDGRVGLILYAQNNGFV